MTRFSRGDPNEGKVSLYKLTGIPNAVTYHVWNWIIIFDSLGKYVLFNTNIFGHYTSRKGILSMWSQQYAGIIIMVMYLYAFLVPISERDFITLWIYKAQVIVLAVAAACYALDGIFYIFDKHTFCTMQLESSKTCDERNEFFLVQVAFFFVVWVPIWAFCADAIRRYAHELNQLEGSSRDHMRGDDRVIDPKNVDVRHFA